MDTHQTFEGSSNGVSKVCCTVTKKKTAGHLIKTGWTPRFDGKLRPTFHTFIHTRRPATLASAPVMYSVTESQCQWVRGRINWEIFQNCWASCTIPGLARTSLQKWLWIATWTSSPWLRMPQPLITVWKVRGCAREWHLSVCIDILSDCLSILMVSIDHLCARTIAESSTV